MVKRNGYNLLMPSQFFQHQKDAFKFARRLGAPDISWTFSDFSAYNNSTVVERIDAAHEKVMTERAAEDVGILTYDEGYDPPFIIQVERTEGGRLFHVTHKVTGDTHETFNHRGLAVKAAEELNSESLV